MKYRPLIFFAPLFVAGCAQTGKITQLGPDTYLATGTHPSTSALALTAAAESANKYCANLSKMILVDSQSFGGGDASITFKCLDKNDPSLKRPRYERSPDTVIKVQ